MSGVWTVPVVELDEDQDKYYKLIKGDELVDLPKGVNPPGSKYYPFIYGVANASYRLRAMDMIDIVGHETYNKSETSERVTLLGVIELSKPEHTAVRNTWYRLIAAGRDSDAEELFWNVAALNQLVRVCLSRLVKGLSSWGELDEWGVPVEQ